MKKGNFIKDINYCGICGSPGKSHKECYKNYCSLCCYNFNNNKELKEHAEIYHEKQWCDKCNQIFKYLKNHTSGFH